MSAYSEPELISSTHLTNDLYKNLIDKHKSTQEELAELVGRSRPYITNTMRLLNLSDEVKKYIVKKSMRALLKRRQA